MDLDTYRSRAVEGVFVTLRSNEGRAIIGLVDELSKLGLDPVRLRYEISDDDAHAAFARFVLTEIVRKGYATHGSDGSPLASLGRGCASEQTAAPPQGEDRVP